jgi:hypothetical protein
MNKNAKIALGCGGAGCLGIIILGVVGLVIYFYTGRTAYRNYNYNSNYNINTNTNTNTNRNTNRNGNVNSNSSTPSSSSMSDDDKHKLFHAATVTADLELIRRVNVKLGILNDDFTPGDNYTEFVSAHSSWASSNTDFILTVATQAKARAYVEEHIDD